ncbi:MAG: hypothetical protein NVS4B10_25310 [Myxococcales bacterium]
MIGNEGCADGLRRRRAIRRRGALAIALSTALILPAIARAAPPGVASAGPASAGVEWVPASAAGALLLDGAGGAAGLRTSLSAAGALAPALEPGEVGAELARRVSTDLLSPAAGLQAGLAPAGPRALIFTGAAEGVSAPVADPARAARVLSAWLDQAGPSRRARPSRVPGPRTAGRGAQERAGLVARFAGAPRLLAASGAGAAALVEAMARAAARRAGAPSLARDPAIRAALKAAQAPAVLWLRGSGPAAGAVAVGPVAVHR